MIEGVIESAIGTFIGGLALTVPVAYIIKKKLSNSPLVNMFA